MRPNEFPFDKFEKIMAIKYKVGNPGHKNRVVYKNIVTAFDIETTALTEIEQSVMYIWQWYFDGIGLVIGRTWIEFMEFCRNLKKVLDVNNQTLVIYDHVLSYEFQFLKGIYHFKDEDVFAVEPRKIIKAVLLQRLEFRDSYILTNMSLDEFTEKMDVENKKLSGKEFDYTKRRFAWTTLSDYEMQYAANDVVGLVQAIKKLMDLEGDTLATIPLTSTGYVRRDTRRAMRTVRKGLASGILPYYNLYKMAREAFRGGDTHANRYIVGNVLENLDSYDRVSSYLDVALNYLFPTRPFHMSLRTFTKSEVDKMIYTENKPLLFRACFFGIRLKNPYWGDPYIPKHKCRDIKNFVNDNGRILSADYLKITITDVDYRIIDKEYIFDDFATLELAYSGYQKLPEQWTDTIKLYYQRKTQLKNVKGKEQEYMLSKAKANSEYGMAAQQPVKQSLVFNDLNCLEYTNFAEEDLYYEAQKKCFLSYAWGVWITSWARYALHKMLWTIDEQGAIFCYCDTDCAKYQGKVDWSKYNDDCIAADKISGGYATDKHGIVHYLGTVEKDYTILKFKTLGAKKYVWTQLDDGKEKLHVTIAGVNKKKGAKELEAAGGINAFKSGFVFRNSAGTESVYNDYNYGIYEVEGHKILVTANLYIKDSEYTLGLTGEYLKLLKNIIHGGII